MAVRGGRRGGGPDLPGGERVGAGQVGQVHEVPPPGAGRSALQDGDGLLRDDRDHRVAHDRDVLTEEPRQGDQLRGRPYRVAGADVQADHEPVGVQGRRDADAEPAVVVLVADLLDADLRTEDEPVRGVDGGDGGHHVPQVLLVELEVQGLHVDVAGGSPQPVRGEQDPTPEGEVVAVHGAGQPVQDALEPVQGHQLVGGAPLLAGQALELAVDVRGAHVRYARASRIGVWARGIWRAISMSCAGWEPRRPSQVRSASMASSYPWVPRSRNASAMDRSALYRPIRSSVPSMEMSSRPRSNVAGSKLCQDTGAEVDGAVLPRGMAMSIRPGIVSVRPCRARAEARAMVACGARRVISSRSRSAGGAPARRYRPRPMVSICPASRSRYRVRELMLARAASACRKAPAGSRSSVPCIGCLPRCLLSPTRNAICSCLLYTSPSPRDGLLSRMP